MGKRFFVAVMILLGGGLGGLLVFVGGTLPDIGTVKPALIAAVQRASGQTLTIGGQVGFRFTPFPAIAMEDVTIGGPPASFSTPLLRIARVTLSPAWLPLLLGRVEITRISLRQPTLILDRDIIGHGNWEFGTETPDKADNGRVVLAPLEIEISDGIITRREPGIPDREMPVPHAILSGPTGSIRAFLNDPAGTTWPAELTWTADDLTLAVHGTIAHPWQGRGVAITLDGIVRDSTGLSRLMPSIPATLPKDTTFRMELGDDVGGKGMLRSVDVMAKSIDLGSGFRLDDASWSVRETGPGKLNGTLFRPGVPIAVSGTLGDLAWVKAGASGPTGVDLTWKAPLASGTLKGVLPGTPAKAGTGLDLSLSVPDPRALIADAPPGLGKLTVKAHVTALTSPIRFDASANCGVLTGTVTMIFRDPAAVGSWGPLLSGVVPRFAADVTSEHFDLDVYFGPNALPRAESVNGVKGAAVTPVASELDYLTRDLPFALPPSVAADVKFRANRLHVHGGDVRDLAGTMQLADGLLKMFPIYVAAPRINGAGASGAPVPAIIGPGGRIQ
jgi:AsmA protein